MKYIWKLDNPSGIAKFRQPQQHCKVFVNHFWFFQNFKCFGRSGASKSSPTKFWFWVSHKQKLQQKSHLAKSSNTYPEDCLLVQNPDTTNTKKQEKNVGPSVVKVLQKPFSCFFVFLVCRFCTSKQSFGYVLLNLARCVFVEVFFALTQNQNLVGELSEAPDLPKHLKCWENQKWLTETLQSCWGCLNLAMPLGLSNFQIYFTILAIYHLRPAYIV